MALRAAIALGIVSLAITCLDAMAGNGPLSLHSQAIDATEEFFTKEASRSAQLRNDVIPPIFSYLQQLRTNWTGTLNLAPHSFRPSVWPVAEAFQFYFAGRTNREDRNASDLIFFPPRPIAFDAARLTTGEWRNLRLAEIRLRVAWFRSLLQFQPQQALISDPSSLVILAHAAQNLDRLSVEGLNALLSQNDFDTVVDAIRAVPPLTDEYLKELAARHAKPSHRQDFFARGDRLSRYKEISRQFSRSVRSWYNAVWISNPAVFEMRMSALASWISEEVEYFDNFLSAAKSLNERNEKVISNVSELLEWYVERLRIYSTTNVTFKQIPVPEKLSEQDRARVRELDAMLRFKGQHFDVDYISRCSNVVATLRAGSWKDAVMVVQPNDVSANLVLPLEEYAAYTRRHPKAEFVAVLNQMLGRVEALRDVARGLETKAHE